MLLTFKYIDNNRFMARIMCFASNCVNYINNEYIEDIVKIGSEKSCHVNCSTYVAKSLEYAMKHTFNVKYLYVLTKNLDYKGNIDHKIICNCKECTYNFANTCTSTDINVCRERTNNFSNIYCKKFL